MERWPWVLLVQAVLVAVVYLPYQGVAFLSDAWVYLATLRRGVWSAIAAPIGYHWQPVAVSWVALIRSVGGERAAFFQLVDLVQLAVFAHLAYHLGRRLGVDAGSSLLASLVVIASATHYEATYWPLAGNMHLVAAQLYMLALLVACDLAGGRRIRSGAWLLALVVAGAVFAHPAMITSIPLCILILVLRDPTQAPWRVRWRRLLRLSWPLGVVVAAFATARIAMAPLLYGVPQPGFEAERFYWLALNGLLGLFSLRGSHEFLVWMMTFGTGAPYPSPGFWACVGAWLVVGGLAAALCWWRARDSGIRLLLAFLVVHLLALTIAGPVTSRQCQLPAVPAALLMVWVLRALGSWLAARVPRVPSLWVAGGLPVLACVLLAAGAYRDHRAAARVHSRASSAVRQAVTLVAERAARSEGVKTVTFVNMPAVLRERGVMAYAFQNGLPEITRLASRAAATADLRQLDVDTAPPEVTPGSQPIELGEIAARVADPAQAVLIFEVRPFGVRALTPQSLEAMTSGRPRPAAATSR